MSLAETCLPEGEALKSHQPPQDSADGESIMLLEPRPFRPFKTSEEYLYAMKEDLAEWLNNLYSMDINVDSFFERLDTGEVLCALSGKSLQVPDVSRKPPEFPTSRILCGVVEWEADPWGPWSRRLFHQEPS
nr:uncharacterized protein LOC123763663 [Procambarus clarkii]